MYGGAELERKLDAFQRVQSILDDHKSNGLGDYEEKMKNIYGKDGFFVMSLTLLEYL